MPKNVMKLLKPSPHRARNDFDLSHRHIFSANFGELLPATCIETVPGDHIEMHISDLLRTIPMVTSPFLRAKQHFDVWFVPYRDLWHNFDQFITQKTEPVSSAMRNSTFLPHSTLLNVYTAITGASYPDIIGRSGPDGGMKLLNLLGYGDRFASFSDANDSASFNIFRLLAYNFIWYNEYRQQYYDDGTINVPTTGLPNNMPTANRASILFNADAWTCDTASNARYNATQLRGLLQMRYRCWKKDLYTGLLPSTQFGTVSTIESNFAALYNKVADGTSYDARTLNDTSGALALFDSSNQVVSGSTSWKTNNFDVLALRKSEAVQIWRENALRAGNHIKDNMEAHYGVSSDFQDHRPRFLGSVSAPLNIGDVMATANSSTGVNDTVGDIAGKGLSSIDEKVFKYDAKEFGVIMVMFSLLPETEYNAQGIDRMNQLLEPEDFFIPEYENLGLEAVSSQNFYALKPSQAKVVGYAPRYYGYKTKLDKVFGSFQSQYNGVTGYNAVWASPNFPAQNAMAAPSVAIPLGTLYVNPAVYDVNFSQSVGNVDQFLCDIYFDVDAVRPMSVSGLPFS